MMSYDAIYLAPHLDDVALSCGGQIWQQTAVQSILIVTITAGDPPHTVSAFADKQHDGWQLHQTEQVAAMRRAEDKVASQLLRADFIHWDFLDCIYRTHPDTREPYYISESDIFGAIHPMETELVDQITSQIQQLPTHSRLYAPLTLGGHVDHQITRLAAEKAQTAPIFYYEDYPYAQVTQALAHMWPLQEKGAWQSSVITLTPEAIEARLQAIEAYGSQINTLFGRKETMRQQVKGYVNKTGGERVWQQTRASK